MPEPDQELQSTIPVLLVSFESFLDKIQTLNTFCGPFRRILMKIQNKL